jgi:hypothetical protein
MLIAQGADGGDDVSMFGDATAATPNCGPNGEMRRERFWFGALLGKAFDPTPTPVAPEIVIGEGAAKLKPARTTAHDQRLTISAARPLRSRMRN